MHRHPAENVFALMDREIWLLTCSLGGRRGGLVATLVSQASIVPDQPRVWVGLSPQHHTTSLVLQARSFLLHLVDENQADLVWNFGTVSGHDTDKFQGTEWEESRLGHPLLPSSLAWMECQVESFAETGDRIFFLCRIESACNMREGDPLTLKRWRPLLTPTQAAEVKARLARDGRVDAELIRRWQEAGYRPLTLEPGAFTREDPRGERP